MPDYFTSSQIPYTIQSINTEEYTSNNKYNGSIYDKLITDYID